MGKLENKIAIPYESIVLAVREFIRRGKEKRIHTGFTPVDMDMV